MDPQHKKGLGNMRAPNEANSLFAQGRVFVDVILFLNFDVILFLRAGNHFSTIGDFQPNPDPDLFLKWLFATLTLTSTQTFARTKT
jgi:hypothetical protein